MREYELVLVVHPELDDEGVNAVVDQVRSVITDSGGEVTLMGQLTDGSGQIAPAESWKRRKLAYPIQKLREGYYVVMRTQVEKETLDELDRHLKLNEAVLRHLLVKVDES
ncbi:MAG TPA: 30S ribosomal protein S6 [Anaerolineae bacterium]|nr:30S ribosomal protein S6 [Anaerolineae bacterium]